MGGSATVGNHSVSCASIPSAVKWGNAWIILTSTNLVSGHFHIHYLSRTPIVKDPRSKEFPPRITLGKISPWVWEVGGTLSVRLLEMERLPGAPSHALLLSSSPSWGARPAPCQRSTVPWRLALFQATGSSLRGRAPSGDAPGGLLGALLLTGTRPSLGSCAAALGPLYSRRCLSPARSSAGAIPSTTS